MQQRSLTLARAFYTMGSLSVIACVGDTSEPPPKFQDAKLSALYSASQPPASASQDSGATEPPKGVAASRCDERGVLEPDLFTLPLDGPGVSFGALKPGKYVLSSTYLRLKKTEAASSKFWEVMGPIFEDLSTRDGLVAVSLGVSFECNTARTLSVWRDEVAMIEFATDSAHSAAVAAGGELNSGGSVVMHWTGDETQASWKVAAQKLAEYDGPTL